jgi:hypothetical protein
MGGLFVRLLARKIVIISAMTHVPHVTYGS